jgi:uncharacterized protein
MTNPASTSSRPRRPLAFRDHVHLLDGGNVVAVIDAVNFQAAYVAPRWLPLLTAIERKTAADIDLHLQSPESAAFVEHLGREGLLAVNEHVKDRLATFRESIRPRPVRVLDIIPTFVCNLACSYCYQHSEVDGSGRWRGVFLDVAQAEKIVDAFLGQRLELDADDGVPSEMCFIGGEPLLHIKLIRSLVKRARRHAVGQPGSLNLTIVTNGTLVTPEIAQFCANHDVFVIVSLDGRREVNDRARMSRGGIGCFDAAKRGYELLKDAGCRVAICQTVGDHNVATYVDEVLYLLDTLRPHDLCSNSCLHALPGRNNPHQVEATEFGVQLATLYVERVRSRPISGLPEQAVRRFRPFLTRAPLFHYCGAQTEKIVIAPNGRASFCEGFAFLNIGTATWQERLTNQLGTSQARACWSDQSPVNIPECSQCALVLQCGGGCRYDGFSRGGTLAVRDSYRCEQDRQLFKWFILEFLPTWCDAAPTHGEQVVMLTDDRRKAILRRLSHHESHVEWR